MSFKKQKMTLARKQNMMLFRKQTLTLFRKKRWTLLWKQPQCCLGSKVGRYSGSKKRDAILDVIKDAI